MEDENELVEDANEVVEKKLVEKSSSVSTKSAWVEVFRGFVVEPLVVAVGAVVLPPVVVGDVDVLSRFRKLGENGVIVSVPQSIILHSS